MSMYAARLSNICLSVTNTTLSSLTVIISGGNIINKHRLTEPGIMPKVELTTNIGLNVPDFLNSHFLETCALNQQIATETEKEIDTSLGSKYII